MSRREEHPGSGSRQAKSGSTARRVVLTVLIIGGAMFFMVLPWAFLFHSPEQFAGWAASGVVLAVAVHLFLNTRKRRRTFQEMMEEDEDPDGSP